MEITSRTVQSRFLLRPIPEVRATIDGILARAQRRYGVTLHVYVVLMSHFHLLATFDDAKQMARATRYVKSNIARKVGRLIGWKGPFWERRYSAIVVSEEEQAQLERLWYLLENGVKENLVGSPEEWPGATSARALLDGSMMIRGHWLDLTALHEARQRGESAVERRFLLEEELELEPLPCWSHLEPEEYRQRIRAMVDHIAAEAARRHEEAGTEPLGIKKLRRLGANDCAANPSRRPAPLVHAASKKARQGFWKRYAMFATAFLAASADLRKGIKDVVFPEGSFPPGLPFVPLRAPPGLEPA